MHRAQYFMSVSMEQEWIMRMNTRLMIQSSRIFTLKRHTVDRGQIGREGSEYHTEYLNGTAEPLP
jgi:hypothetical protein